MRITGLFLLLSPKKWAGAGAAERKTKKNVIWLKTNKLWKMKFLPKKDIFKQRWHFLQQKKHTQETTISADV